jgi:acylphosphatase
MIRRRLMITGRLRDPLFRESYLREAQHLGVRGWALNREDGRTEAVFEGEPEAVDAMIAWARVGPAHTYVTSIEIVEEAPDGEEGFAIH